MHIVNLETLRTDISPTMHGNFINDSSLVSKVVTNMKLNPHEILQHALHLYALTNTNQFTRLEIECFYWDNICRMIKYQD